MNQWFRMRRAINKWVFDIGSYFVLPMFDSTTYFNHLFEFCYYQNAFWGYNQRYIFSICEIHSFSSVLIFYNEFIFYTYPSLPVCWILEPIVLWLLNVLYTNEKKTLLSSSLKYYIISNTTKNYRTLKNSNCKSTSLF